MHKSSEELSQELTSQTYQVWKKELHEYVQTKIKPLLNNINTSTEDIVQNVISYFLQKYRNIDEKTTSSSFINISDLRNLHSGEENISVNNNDILIGLLRNTGSLKRHIYIEQENSRLPCHMVSVDVALLGCVVFLEKWSCVTMDMNQQKQGGYIEVYQTPVILYNPAISAKKSTVKNNKMCNFIGTVEYCVTCGNIKNLAFVVKLKNDRTSKIVLITGDEFAFWKNCFSKGATLKLDNLKACKIKVGNNKIQVLSNVTDTTLRILSPSPYLNNKNFHLMLPEFVSLVNSLTLNDKKTNSCCCDHPICSIYIGEVSEVIDPHLGIYFLDKNKVVLHCSYMLCEDRNCGVRPGALIMVEKCHLYKATVIGLVGCSRSSVTLLRHSRNVSVWQPTLVVKNLVVKNPDFYSIHPTTLANINSIRTEVCKILPFLGQSNLEFYLDSKKENSIMFNILRNKHNKNKCCLCGTQDTVCNHTLTCPNRHQEILLERHQCTVQNVLHCDSTSFEFLNVKALLSMLKDFCDLNNSFAETNSKDYWTYNCIPRKEVLNFLNMSENSNLIVCLDANKITGQLHACDGTATIPCLVVKEMVDAQTDITRLSSFTEDTSLCLDDKHSVIKIHDFNLIIEGQLNLKTNEYEFWSYLMVSFRDINVVKRARNSLPMQYDVIGCKNNQINYENQNNATKVVKMFPKKRKSQNSISPSSAKKRKTSSNNNSLQCEESTVKYFFIMHRHIIQSESVIKPSCNVSAYILDEKVGSEVHMRFRDQALKWLPFLQPGSVVKLVEVLQSSCKLVDDSCQFTKIFTVPNKCSLHHVHDPMQLKHLKTLNAVKRSWVTSYYGRLYNSFCHVNKLISEPNRVQSQSGFVNVLGKILERSAYLDEVSFEQTYCYRMEIADISCKSQFCVYFNNTIKLKSHAGLLPGSVVLLKGIRITVSRKGTVYGKFLHSSQLVVKYYIKCNNNHFMEDSLSKCFPTTSNNVSCESKFDNILNNIEKTIPKQFPTIPTTVMDNSNYNLPVKEFRKNNPSTYIMHLYNGLEHNSSKTIHIFASVVNIYKFQIRLKCKKCGLPPFHNKHLVKVCGKHMLMKNSNVNYENIVMESMVKCSISDSTGTLYIHFDQDTIESFLKMANITLAEFNDIKDMVARSQSGEVTYHKACQELRIKEKKVNDDTVNAVVKAVMNNVNRTSRQPYNILIRVRVEASEIRSDESSTEDFLCKSRYAMGQISIDGHKTMHTLYLKTINCTFVQFFK